jgi:4-hydroxy-3-methylbut-2-enyl diphosphate reductase
MEIRLSETVGFCYGVRKAVDLSVKTLSEKKGKVFSVGPLIHNPQVVKELSKKGLKPVKDPKKIKRGTLIISSHGAGATFKAGKKKRPIEVIDATCPFVKKIQDCVKGLYRDGYRVIIVGKKEHPEVKGLIDFTGGGALVIKDAKEARRLNAKDGRVGVVSQSTYSEAAFLEIASILLEKPFTELRIFNTICRDTVKRQTAARELTGEAEAVMVVGGKDSSNTKRLLEVCAESGKPAYHIEDADEIDPSWLEGRRVIGITSGASTPDWVVQKIIKKMRRM